MLSTMVMATAALKRNLLMMKIPYPTKMITSFAAMASSTFKNHFSMMKLLKTIVLKRKTNLLLRNLLMLVMKKRYQKLNRYFSHSVSNEISS
jgi:hypothetical protein